MTSPTIAAPEVSAENGRSYITIPWGRADDLHERLKRLGHVTTLCLVPLDRQARLELRPGVDPAPVLAALEELLGNGLKRAA